MRYFLLFYREIISAIIAPNLMHISLRLLILIGLWVGLFAAVPAQTSTDELPLQAEVAQAIEQGTRTPAGTPGPNYWQNRAAYRIRATLTPDTRLVEASGRLTYYNQSPDALDTIVVRLHQNIYRPAFADQRDDQLGDKELTDGIIFTRLEMDDVVLDLPGPDPRVHEDHTLLYLMPEEPLASGDSLVLDADWQFTITQGGTIRQGTYGKHSFFVGYWYPQFAVYDDVHGWDRFQYTGLHEFYQDFADFDVQITAPDSLLVWATGELQNIDEVLTPTYASRLRRAMRSSEVIQIVGEEDRERGTAIAQPGAPNTWHFVAEGVPDFAFASADYYYWDATSALVEDSSRRVLVDACYQPQAQDFYSVAGFAQAIIEFLSSEMPGVPYPYPAMTVYNGDLRGFGGGMEYPMMCNDGSSFAEAYAFELTHHEIAHTYFPFMTGINEHRYAWMEEGWASYLPTSLMGQKGYTSKPMYSNVATYQAFAGSEREVSLMTPAYTVRGQSYWTYAYQKPAVAYHLLRQELGDAVFKKALRGYIERWTGKHPTPYDFFYSFEDLSGQDLGWFFRPWFFEKGAPDLALDIDKVKRKRARFTVVKKGAYPVPVKITVSLKGGETEVITYPASVWKDGTTELDINERFGQRITAIQLGDSQIPDANRDDNVYEGGQ
jgi:hypothetical protein